MIARVKLGDTPAWTDGEKWYSSVVGIAMILNGKASRQLVHDEVGGYIPDMAYEMAQYAHKTIPRVTIVGFDEEPEDQDPGLDSDGRQPIYGSRSS